MSVRTKIRKWLLRFDRSFSEKIWRQIFILVGFIVIAFLFGLIISYFLTFGKNGSQLSFYEWAFYLLIDGNALNNIYMDEYPDGGRRWVVLFAVLGSLLGIILFGGMLVSVLSNMLERRIENYRKGKNIYVREGHYVILGYDEIVPAIIRSICENRDVYILLQSSIPAEQLSEKLHASIAQEFEDRIIIKNGQRTSLQDLSELRLNRARQIFVVGDRKNISHDALNIDCMEKITYIINENIVKGIPESITTVFEDPDTYLAMQVTDLFENIRKLGIEFIPYNFYIDWAKQIFVDRKYTENIANQKITYKYPSVDGVGIKDDDKKHVHIVIVGLSTFGVALAIEAAKILHFPNFKKGENLTRITFIDLDADKEKDLFITRFRHFFEVQHYLYNGERIPASKFTGENADFLDIEFEFVKGDVYSKVIQDLILNWTLDESRILSLFFSLSDSRQNLAISMNLPDEVYDKEIPLFVRQNTTSKFLSTLRTKSNTIFNKTLVKNNVPYEIPTKGKYSNIYPYGMLDIVLDMEKNAQKIAECINHIYCESEKIGWQTPNQEEVKSCSWDKIHEKWLNLDVANQWSNIYSAYNIEYRIRTLKAMRGNDDPIVKLSEDEVNVLAKVEHNRWNVEKLLLGYRKPSEQEDALMPQNFVEGKKFDAMKTSMKNLFIHCDIRPYGSLDKIKELDKEIVRYMPWFLEMIKKIRYENN